MKRKSSKKSSSGNLTLVFMIVAVVTIFYQMAQLQMKDKQIKLLTGGVGVNAEKSKEMEKREKIKKEPVLSKEQEIAARNQIHENLDKIILKKPKMASKWVLSDVKFNDNGTVTLFYEDGHEAGEITFKHSNPSDYRTWQRTGGE